MTSFRPPRLRKLIGTRTVIVAAAADLRQQLDRVDDVLDEAGAELTALMKELCTAAVKDPAAKSPPKPSP